MNENTENQVDLENEDNGGETSTNSLDNVKDIEELKKMVKDLRKESADYRVKFQTMKKQVETTNPSLEQATSKITELEGLVNELKVSELNTKILKVATDFNFHNPEVAKTMLAGAELTDEKSIAKQLTEIVKANPYLVKNARIDGSNKEDRNEGDFNMNSWLKSQIK